MKPELKKWDNLDDRKEACVKVLTQVLADDHFRCDCLASDEFVRQAFVEVGGIDVPGDVKIVFVPEGDLEDAQQHQRGSLVLEVPKKGTSGRDKLLAQVRCTYAQWIQLNAELIKLMNPSKGT